MKKNISLIVAIILGVLLIVALGYIGYGFYTTARYNEQVQVYQAGYEYAISQIMQQTGSCQSVPLMSGNQTLTIVAIECLNVSK